MDSKFQKQEALQSLEVARRALKEKNVEKAKKFAFKAQKLCSCPEVETFLSQLQSAESSKTSNSAQNIRRRSQAQGKKEQQGTEEQRALIARIKRSKDFYEVLDLSRDCSEDDIRRSYKKLALKLHPDKNKASGAEEAFKAVSRAASCLTDPEKRRNYDTYGTEDRAQAAGQSYQHHHHEFFQDDFDPQEIFNMFFGGQFPMEGRRVYRTNFDGPFHHHRSSRNVHQESAEPVGLKGLIRFLPLLLLFAFTFFSNTSMPAYNLYRDYTYRDMMKTVDYRVPFYVKSKSQFERTYPKNTIQRRQIEYQIENSFKSVLEAQCREEKVTKRRLYMLKGKSTAEKYQLNSCVELKNIFYPSVEKETATESH